MSKYDYSRSLKEEAMRSVLLCVAANRFFRVFPYCEDNELTFFFPPRTTTVVLSEWCHTVS